MATYRDGAFGGSADQIVPVLDAASAAVEKTWADHPGLLPLGIVPLTHQDMDETIEHAMARSAVLPAREIERRVLAERQGIYLGQHFFESDESLKSCSPK